MAQVVDMAAFRKPQQAERLRAWGSVKTHARSSRLYIQFNYLGNRIEKSTGLHDTPQNRVTAERFLDRCREHVENGTFRFAEVFPGASEDEKRHFAGKEGGGEQVSPADVVFGEYLEGWLARNAPEESRDTKARDYRSAIDAHIRGRFGSKRFSEITGVDLVDFVNHLKRLKGKRRGRGMSASRIRNVLTALRAILGEAREKYQWENRDPFLYFDEKNARGALMPKTEKNPPAVFRFAEWSRLCESIDPWYRPIIELMVMTGMIASEVRRLTREDWKGNRLHVRGTKTRDRDRELPVGAGLQRVLDELANRAEGPALGNLHTGKPFDASRFQGEVWAPALERAGIAYRRPYATRHSFALWSLVIDVHPTRLVKLMGHASKKMVYETYGEYRDGVEEDAAAIRAYFEGSVGWEHPNRDEYGEVKLGGSGVA